jgi:uncharacterized protein YkwD
VNVVRLEHRLPALRPARRLAGVARRHARNIVHSDRFVHSAQPTPGFQVLGEVLAFRSGWRLRPAAVVAGWMRSPVHRAILLRPDLRYLGIGWARGRLQGRLATVWVAQLGSR